MWSKVDIEALRELKEQDPLRGYTGRSESGDEYRIQVQGRGELVFYQRGDKATFVEILAGYGVISAKSIRWWDDNKKIARHEKEEIIQHLSDFLRLRGSRQITIA